jgi:hypothetical protein
LVPAPQCRSAYPTVKAGESEKFAKNFFFLTPSKNLI